MADVKWVIAGKHDEYWDWLKRNDYYPQEWKYVDSVSTLRGHTNPHGIFIGTYYLRQDIRAILLQLQVSTHGTNDALAQAWKKVELYAPER